MKILFWLVVVVYVVYKIATHPRVVLSFFEIQISQLRPRIAQYLHGELSYWKGILAEFKNGDKVARTVFQNEEEIVNHIRNTEKDLNIDVSYQRLKCKYLKKDGSLIMLAHNYLIFLQCLNFFRSTKGTDATNPAYANTALEMGAKKSAVYRTFDELLSA